MNRSLDTQVPDLSFPEWALINFLRRIKTDVVQVIMNRWRESLQADLEKPEAFNVISGLLNLQPDGTGTLPEITFHQRLYQGQGLTSEEWQRHLDSHGHRLFNSYFLFPVKALGQSMLVPFVLGGRDKDKFEQLQEFVKREELPYELGEEQRYSFASQLLPCNSGISPFFYHLVCERWSEVAGLYNDIPVQIAPMWLGKLNLLHKRQDYQLGSLSGMVAALWDMDNPGARVLGVYVLTCSIPAVFAERDARNLYQVVTHHCRSEMLGKLPDRPDLAKALGARDPWTWFSTALIRERGSAAMTEARNHAASILKREQREQVLSYRTEISEREADRTLDFRGAITSINQIALYRLIRGLFPTGPWCLPELVTKLDVKSDLPCIDENMLADHNQWLLNLVAGSEDYSLQDVNHKKSAQVMASMLALLLPEQAKRILEGATGHTDLVQIINEFTLSIPVADSKDRKGGYLIGFLASKSTDVKDALQALEGFIPSRQGELDTFQQRWLQYQDRSAVGEEAEGNEPTKGFYLLLGRVPQIRAVLFVQRSEVFIPTSMQEPFADTIRQWPLFWLLEDLCRKYWSGEAVARDCEQLRPMTQGFHHKEGAAGWKTEVTADNCNLKPAMDVAADAPNSSEEFKRLVSAVNFLGAPVSDWRRLAEDRGPIEQYVTALYRRHLDEYLAMKEGMLCISEVLAAIHSNLSVRGIKIRLSTPDQVTLIVETERTDTPPETHVLEWKTTPTYELAFCAINDHSLKEALDTSLDYWKDAKSLGLISLNENDEQHTTINLKTYYHSFDGDRLAEEGSAVDSVARRALLREIGWFFSEVSEVRASERLEMQRGWSHALKNSFLPIRDAADSMAKLGKSLLQFHKGTTQLFAAQVVAAAKYIKDSRNIEVALGEDELARLVLDKLMFERPEGLDLPILRLPGFLYQVFRFGDKQPEYDALSPFLEGSDGESDYKKIRESPILGTFLARLERLSDGMFLVGSMVRRVDEVHNALLRFSDENYYLTPAPELGLTLGHGIAYAITEGFTAFRALLSGMAFDGHYRKTLASIVDCDPQSDMPLPTRAAALEAFDKSFSRLCGTNWSKNIIGDIQGCYDGGDKFPLRFELDLQNSESEVLRKVLYTPLVSDAVRAVSVIVSESLTNMFKHSERRTGDQRLSLALRIKAENDQLVMIFENRSSDSDCALLSRLEGQEFHKNNQSLARKLSSAKRIGSLFSNFSIFLKVTAGQGRFQIRVDGTRVLTKYSIPLELFGVANEHEEDQYD